MLTNLYKSRAYIRDFTVLSITKFDDLHLAYHSTPWYHWSLFIFSTLYWRPKRRKHFQVLLMKWILIFVLIWILFGITFTYLVLHHKNLCTTFVWTQTNTYWHVLYKLNDSWTTHTARTSTFYRAENHLWQFWHAYPLSHEAILICCPMKPFLPFALDLGPVHPWFLLIPLQNQN